MSQPGGNRSESCASTRGRVSTQYQLEGTIKCSAHRAMAAQHRCVAKQGTGSRENIQGRAVSAPLGGGLSPSLPILPTLSALSLMGWLLAAFPSQNSHRKLRSFFCCVGSRENGHFSYFKWKSFFLLDKGPKQLWYRRKNKAGDRWTPLVDTRDDQWLVSGCGRLSQ
jgi:hypothetical protein